MRAVGYVLQLGVDHLVGSLGERRVPVQYRPGELFDRVVEQHIVRIQKHDELRIGYFKSRVSRAGMSSVLLVDDMDAAVARCILVENLCRRIRRAVVYREHAEAVPRLLCKHRVHALTQVTFGIVRGYDDVQFALADVFFAPALAQA